MLPAPFVILILLAVVIIGAIVMVAKVSKATEQAERTARAHDNLVTTLAAAGIIVRTGHGGDTYIVDEHGKYMESLRTSVNDLYTTLRRKGIVDYEAVEPRPPR